MREKSSPSLRLRPRNLAEDGVAAIDVEYESLPFAATLDQVMAPDAPQTRPDRENVSQSNIEFGDVDGAFEAADVVREFTYYFGGARPIPMQPASCVAKWDGDQLTFYAMGQRIYPHRQSLARGLGIDESNIRFINKWNGGTFGPDTGSVRFQVFISHIAKMTGRPMKISLPKDQELGQMSVKPESLTHFKVGATSDGRITVCQREVHIAVRRRWRWRRRTRWRAV